MIRPVMCPFIPPLSELRAILRAEPGHTLIIRRKERDGAGHASEKLLSVGSECTSSLEINSSHDQQSERSVLIEREQN